MMLRVFLNFTLIIAVLAKWKFDKEISKVLRFSRNVHENDEDSNGIRNFKRITENVDIFSRRNKNLNSLSERETDVTMFVALQTSFNFDEQEILDVCVFPLGNEGQFRWFIVVLDPSGMTLHLLNYFKNHTVEQVVWHEQANARHILLATHSAKTLFILWTETNFLVSRLQILEKTYSIAYVQQLASLNITHLTTWSGMNQLYLAVATSSGISIYIWLGEHFDKVQFISIATERIIPFHNRGFMHLLAVGRNTVVLRFSLRANKFLRMQNLAPARCADSLILSSEWKAERFLALSALSSTVIYKLVRDRFMPLQELSSTEQVILLASGRTVVLMALRKSILEVYQYDGWRFVKNGVQEKGVKDVKRMELNGEMLLLRNWQNMWSIRKIIWHRSKALYGLREEISNWCMKVRKEMKIVPKTILDMDDKIKLLRGFVRKLVIENVNGYNVQQLENITKKHQSLFSKLKVAKAVLHDKGYVKNLMSRNRGYTIKDKNYADNVTLYDRSNANNLKLSILHARNVRINCNFTCVAYHLKIESKPEVLFRLWRLTNRTQVLKFKRLCANTIRSWKCPTPVFKMEEVFIKDINGISVERLQNSLLKRSGNQKVSGTHNFSSVTLLHVNAPLTIATQHTMSSIEIREVKTKKLHITGGGIFLPLNGSSTNIPGSIIANKVKLLKNMDLQTKLRGNIFQYLCPLFQVSKPLTLAGNIQLQNLKVISDLHTNDVIKDKKQSLKNILVYGARLSEPLDVFLTLSDNKTKWCEISNRIIKNWVAANSNRPVIISGRKNILCNITLNVGTYKTLSLKLENKLCVTAIHTSKVNTFEMKVDKVVVENLSANEAFGATGLEALLKKFKSSFRDMTEEMVDFTGEVVVNDLQVAMINGRSLEGLEELTKKWPEPELFRGALEVNGLKIHVLHTPIHFIPPPMPLNVINLIVKGDLKANRINKVDVAFIMENTIAIQDTQSLKNITFLGEFYAKQLYTSDPMFKLPDLQRGYSFTEVLILGWLYMQKMNLPLQFGYPQEGSFNLTVRSLVRFNMEPKVTYLNRENLEDLSQRLWMFNTNTIFAGRNLKIEEGSLEGNVTHIGPLETPNIGSWSNIATHKLSNIKSWRVQVPAYIENVETISIDGSNSTILKTDTLEIADLLQNALKRDKVEVIRAKWELEVLNITESCFISKKVNGLNLRTDIVRHDTIKNVLSGKKTVLALSTEDLRALDFSKWVEGALIGNMGKLAIVKGRKIFNSLEIVDLHLTGTIMGRNMSDTLLKSRNQTIHGFKVIQGSVSVPSLIVDGFVNDVNLTELTNLQLKKSMQEQQIKTEVAFQYDLQTTGNLTINDSYNDVEFTHINHNDQVLRAMRSRIKKLEMAIESVNAALQNHARFIHKLVQVKPDSVNLVDSLNHSSLCSVKNSTLLCDYGGVLDLLFNGNYSNVSSLHSVVLKNTTFVVVVQSRFFFIYSFNSLENTIYKVTDMCIENIQGASVRAASNFLWIFLVLPSETLVLRYEPWRNFQQYVLPGIEMSSVIELQGKLEAFYKNMILYIHVINGYGSSLFKTRHFGC
ncbi:hypothetical protein KM043_013853 [Ampulex compressa]|nr:hypothetical protein KM043_013853 [Ampulex compressa]